MSDIDLEILRRIDDLERRIARTEIIESPIFGTYTPTLTNATNLDGSTAFECQYVRISNMVIVSGRVNVDPTVASAITVLGISLPIASNFTIVQQCAGIAFASAVVSEGAAITANIPNDRADMTWITTVNTNHTMYFVFTYQVV